MRTTVGVKSVIPTSNPLDCDTSKLRELPKVLTTTLIKKFLRGTRLIVESNGKKVRDITMGNPHPSS